MMARARDRDASDVLTARVHALLHASRDPFLGFDEIRAGLASADAGAALASRVESDIDLRRALIRLIADKAIAQLAGDRYFIASDFETDGSDN